MRGHIIHLVYGVLIYCVMVHVEVRRYSHRLYNPRHRRSPMHDTH